MKLKEIIKWKKTQAQNEPLFEIKYQESLYWLGKEGTFDKEYYLLLNEDVKARSIDPLEHYIRYGWKEGRKPNRWFDPVFYLADNPDVAQMEMEPLTHYLMAGRAEGRQTKAKLVLPEEYKESLYWIEKEGAFDEEYYLSSNDDIKKSLIDPLEHYIRYGWKEGRKPNRWFDPVFYLADNPDVAGNGIKPLTHYLMVGKAEGRLPAPQEVDNNHLDYVDDIKNIISAEFDKSYYLKRYPDIGNTDVDPLEHYINTGWKEGRKPTHYFDTKFYLDSNPDIKSANINPFYHYIVIGRSEGRMALHPAGYKADVLHTIKNMDEIKKSWKIVHEHPNELVELIEAIESVITKQTKGIVFSFGHDKYIDHVGGIQLCISEEQEVLKRDSYVYINISPAQPLPLLAGAEEKWVGNLIVNRKYIGTFNASDITECAAQIKEVHNHTMFLVIHALHGHQVQAIIDIADVLKPKSSYIWVHDYFTLCPGYNLLRNNLSFCHAPEAKSQGCNICIYGEERIDHIHKIETLFENIDFHVIAPSKHAMDIWKRANRLPHKTTLVLEHRHINFNNNDKIELSKDVQKKLRIAFLGHPALHKGWHTFYGLIERFGNDERYEFYHLGMGQDINCKAHFHEVRSDWDHLTAMTDAIKKYEINVALIWSIWPETYNITMYEALAGGTSVITCIESGNVADEIIKNGKGIVYAKEMDLIKAMEKNDLINAVHDIFKNGICQGEMSSSNITASLIQGEV